MNTGEAFHNVPITHSGVHDCKKLVCWLRSIVLHFDMSRDTPFLSGISDQTTPHCRQIVVIPSTPCLLGIQVLDRCQISQKPVLFPLSCSERPVVATLNATFCCWGSILTRGLTANTIGDDIYCRWCQNMQGSLNGSWTWWLPEGFWRRLCPWPAVALLLPLSPLPHAEAIVSIQLLGIQHSRTECMKISPHEL